MKEINKFYTPAQVAEMLEVSTSTVRRLTIALENEGYTRIHRNNKNHRQYDITDIRALEYVHIKIKNGITQDKAVNDVMANIDYIINKVSDEEVNEVSLNSDNEISTNIDNLVEIIRVLNKTNERQNEMLSELNNKLDDQARQIDELRSELDSTNETLKLSYNQAIETPTTDDHNDEQDEDTNDSENVDNKGINGTQTVKDNTVYDSVHGTELVDEDQADKKKKPSFIARLFGKK